MLIQEYILKNIYIYQNKKYLCTYIYMIHVWTWVYDLQMDLYVCVSFVFAKWLHLSWKNLESDSKHQYNPATPTVDNRMQLDQQIWNILKNGCLAVMMNVSDITRLSNTIHRSSITKYVLLDAQQIWPARCNNARLFTVFHYLCSVFECIYPTILSHNIQTTTYTLYTYEPPERLPPESQIYSSIGGRPVHRWPQNGQMYIQCLKMRVSLMDLRSAITSGLIYRDGHTAIRLLSHSD